VLEQVLYELASGSSRPPAVGKRLLSLRSPSPAAERPRCARDRPVTARLPSSDPRDRPPVHRCHRGERSSILVGQSTDLRMQRSPTTPPRRPILFTPQPRRHVFGWTRCGAQPHAEARSAATRMRNLCEPARFLYSSSRRNKGGWPAQPERCSDRRPSPGRLEIVRFPLSTAAACGWEFRIGSFGTHDCITFPTSRGRSSPPTAAAHDHPTRFAIPDSSIQRLDGAVVARLGAERAYLTTSATILPHAEPRNCPGVKWLMMPRADDLMDVIHSEDVRPPAGRTGARAWQLDGSPGIEDLDRVLAWPRAPPRLLMTSIHPPRVVRPDKARPLMTKKQKLERLPTPACTARRSVRFTPELSRWTGNFVRAVPWTGCTSAKWGRRNFLFGTIRAGNFSLLRTLGGRYGSGGETIDPVRYKTLSLHTPYRAWSRRPRDEAARCSVHHTPRRHGVMGDQAN